MVYNNKQIVYENDFLSTHAKKYIGEKTMKEIVSIKGKRKLLRFYRISLIILASIVLSGCELSSPSSGSSESPFSSFSSSDIYPIQSYTVTWENYDGTILEIDTDVLKGANPSYDGDTPTKEASASQVYNFKG